MNLQESAAHRRVKRIGLVAGPVAACALMAALPREYHTVAGEVVAFSQAGRATLALMIWMAVWWLTEAIDVSATALLPIAVMPIAGIATIKQATAPYGSDLIFLFMGGFILALSMQRWGLDKRIALLTLRMVGSRPRNMVGGFMLATGALSAFVSNTATAAMMLPVALSVIALVTRLQQHSGDLTISRSDDVAIENHGDSDASAVLQETTPSPHHEVNQSNFATCLMLGIAYAASIGGLATIIGTPPNVFLVGFIRDTIDPLHRREISFLQWMLIGVPLAAVFLPIVWLFLTSIVYPVRLKRIEGGREFIASAYRELGPMKAGEWATFIVFLCTAPVWITRPLIAGQLVPALSDSGIAMLGALALFAIPVNAKSADSGSGGGQGVGGVNVRAATTRHRASNASPAAATFVMNWRTAAKLPWGVLILFGGGLSLAAAIESNGVAEFIGSITHHFDGLPPIVVIILVTAAVTFFTELASNTATAATFIPILAAMAPALGTHPFLLIIPACLAATCAFMMPVGTPPNAIVFGGGYVTMPQMIKAGIWLNLIGIALITIVTLVIVKPLLTSPP